MAVAGLGLEAVAQVGRMPEDVHRVLLVAGGLGDQGLPDPATQETRILALGLAKSLVGQLEFSKK